MIEGVLGELVREVEVTEAQGGVDEEGSQRLAKRILKMMMQPKRIKSSAFKEGWSMLIFMSPCGGSIPLAQQVMSYVPSLSRKCIAYPYVCMYAPRLGPFFALYCSLPSRKLIPPSRCLSHTDDIEDLLCSEGPNSLVKLPIAPLRFYLPPRGSHTFRELFFLLQGAQLRSLILSQRYHSSSFWGGLALEVLIPSSRCAWPPRTLSLLGSPCVLEVLILLSRHPPSTLKVLSLLKMNVDPAYHILKVLSSPTQTCAPWEDVGDLQPIAMWPSPIPPTNCDYNSWEGKHM